MRILYTAGAYRSPAGIWGIHQNIQAAREVAAALWAMGAAVICPHTNTAFMDGISTDDAFLRGDLEMIRRGVDALVMLPGWEKSAGARGEAALGAHLGKPVFEWPRQRDTIADYIRGEPRNEQEQDQG